MMLYETAIELPYGHLKPIIEWCQSHCERNWKFEVINDAGSESGSYQFRFESEKDFMTFLVWKK